MKSNTSWIVFPVIIISIAILALFSFITFALLNRDDFGDASLSSFSVQAKAEREITPDRARVTLSVSETGQDATLLNQALDTKTAKIVEFLDSQDVENTVNKNAYDRSYWQENQDRPVQIQSQITATFEDIQQDSNRINRILTESISRGVDTFYDFQFEVSDQDNICEELESKALSALKNKADKQQDLLDIDRTVSTNISLINSTCNNNFGYPISFQEDGISADRETAPNIAISGQRQNLSVEYIMEIRYREGSNSSRITNPLNL